MGTLKRPPRALTCPECDHKWFPVVIHRDTRCPLDDCKSYIFKDENDVIWAKNFVGL